MVKDENMPTTVIWLKVMKKLFLGVVIICGLMPVCSGTTNELWFPVGEQLSYRMYWGVIPVGSCDMATKWVEQGGRNLLSITAVAKTTYVVSKIYPVDDFIESIVDPETFLPVRYTQIMHEGRRVRNDIVNFSHSNNVAYWQSAKQNVTNAVKEIEIGPDTRDVLSLAYFMRSKGLDVGQTEKFRVLVDDKIYDLSITGLKYEEMKVEDFGTVKCLVVEPKAKFGEIFVRKGRVILWFSEDGRHICTRMEGKLTFANLKAILGGVSGPGDDAWGKRAGKTDGK